MASAKRALSRREEKAKAVLSRYGVKEPSLENWRDALRIVDNCARANESVKIKDHLGAFGLAKQDSLKYTPVLCCGAESSERPDALLLWLLRQRTGV